jgi:peptidoglycan/xylan/chitin deacetylase (PgdA/CDA1 family)
LKSAAITIDVDSLHLYREIHGLKPLPEADDPIYTRAVPRFFELLTEFRSPATLFLIGRDAPRYASYLTDARVVGAEIANHSFAHDYRLIKRSADAVKADLEQAHAALQPLSPAGRICGFRAPGYNTSPQLLSAVGAMGYTYDSSRLPSPWYFVARAAAIAAYRLIGRSPRSLIGRRRDFGGRLTPYRENALLELPISCEPSSRIPLIGTTVMMMPERIRNELVLRAINRLPSFNFEMHAIDLLDASEVASDLAKVQRDLQISVSTKMRIFRSLFSLLRQRCRLTTLRDIAQAYC